MLDFGNKIDNADPPQGTLSAAEINALVSQCNTNEANILSLMGNKTYNQSNLQVGYWVLSGSTVAENPSTNVDGWGSLPRISVSSGDVVTVNTLGGYSSRAWALTDKQRNILSVAASGTSPVSATLNVDTDGYLYVNCKDTYRASFAVSVTYNKANTGIEELQEAQEALEQDVDALKQKGAPHYKNNPLPLWQDTLKVLAIGNSFTIDPLAYLDDLVTASRITASNICIYSLTESSTSLGSWVEKYESGDTVEIVRRVGSATMGVTSGTMADILAQNWDVVTLQQLSSLSNDYTSYNPDLTKMIGYIRRNCVNQKVAIAWQSTWSYAEVLGREPKGVGGWEAIVDATKKMEQTDGIDIIIPTGTAIQNARNTSLNTNGEMTRDGQHLAYGVGRYVAAATWFQTLVSPIFGVNVLGNTATHDTTGESSTYEAVSVTAANRGLCQECAFAATIDMWNVTEVE